MLRRLFRDRFVSARYKNVVAGIPYWAVVYVIEKRLDIEPVVVYVSDDDGEQVEHDRVYWLSYWQEILMRFWLHAVQGHPVFGGR